MAVICMHDLPVIKIQQTQSFHYYCMGAVATYQGWIAHADFWPDHALRMQPLGHRQSFLWPHIQGRLRHRGKVQTFVSFLLRVTCLNLNVNVFVYSLISIEFSIRNLHPWYWNSLIQSHLFWGEFSICALSCNNSQSLQFTCLAPCTSMIRQAHDCTTLEYIVLLM